MSHFPFRYSNGTVNCHYFKQDHVMRVTLRGVRPSHKTQQETRLGEGVVHARALTTASAPPATGAVYTSEVPLEWSVEARGAGVAISPGRSDIAVPLLWLGPAWATFRFMNKKRPSVLRRSQLNGARRKSGAPTSG